MRACNPTPYTTEHSHPSSLKSNFNWRHVAATCCCAVGFCQFLGLCSGGAAHEEQALFCLVQLVVDLVAKWQSLELRKGFCISATCATSADPAGCFRGNLAESCLRTPASMDLNVSSRDSMSLSFAKRESQTWPGAHACHACEHHLDKVDKDGMRNLCDTTGCSFGVMHFKRPALLSDATTATRGPLTFCSLLIVKRMPTGWL